MLFKHLWKRAHFTMKAQLCLLCCITYWQVSGYIVVVDLICSYCGRFYRVVRLYCFISEAQHLYCRTHVVNKHDSRAISRDFFIFIFDF